MNLKQKAMLSACAALLSGAMVAQAAEEKAAAEKPAAETAKKVAPHSHAVEKGVIPPQAAPSGSAKKEAKKRKKTTHDHLKEHKGG